MNYIYQYSEWPEFTWDNEVILPLLSDVRHLQGWLERNNYYKILEKTQAGGLDITDWHIWFLNCLHKALKASHQLLEGVLAKARFWEIHQHTELNLRQKVMLNKVMDGFEGKLTSSKWAKITRCSSDTALRDIQDLVEKKNAEERQGRRKKHRLRSNVVRRILIHLLSICFIL